MSAPAETRGGRWARIGVPTMALGAAMMLVAGCSASSGGGSTSAAGLQSAVSQDSLPIRRSGVVAPEVEQKETQVKNFDPYGGVLDYPTLKNFGFRLPYAGSEPHGKKGLMISLEVANANVGEWPEPSGATVDWFIQQQLPEPPTFSQAHLDSFVRSGSFDRNTVYSFYIYEMNPSSQWSLVQTTVLGPPQFHRLIVQSPYENGFAPTSTVLFEIAH